MYTGPNIIKDGLVFGYDTGYGIDDKTRSLRFYKGEPASNVQDSNISAMTQTGFNNWGAYDGNNTPYHSYSSTTQTKTLVNIPGPDGELTNAMLYHNVSGGSFGPTNWSGVPSANLANGKKITLQAWVKAVDSSFVGKSVRPHLYYTKVGGGAYSASTNYSLTMEWQLVKHSYTVPEGAAGNGTFYLFTGGGETKMYVTQTAIIADKLESVVWLQGGTTRSDTASLIDLKETTDIDVSNVSFDSTGQPTFDGTDDVITTSFPATTIPNVTIEAVVYRNQATNRYEAIVQNNTATDDALYVNPSGLLMFWPCGGSSLAVPTGQWSHVAVSYNGTTLTYIVNGTTQVVTATCSHITDWDFLRIGGHATTDTERWIGKIAVAKVYEKSLSEAELTQNYNAYKNRFSI